MNEIDLLNLLSKITIEFGIFDGEGNQRVEVKVLNTDKTFSETTMKIKDVMYLTEYGTLSLPGHWILEKVLPYIDRLLEETLNSVVDKIFSKEIIEENEIINQFRVLKIKIQDYIRNYMKVTISKNNILNKFINQENDDNIYLYDLIDLSKYIKCEIYFVN